MPRTIVLDLNAKGGILNCKKGFRNYKRTLANRCDQFVRRLAEEGFAVAIVNKEAIGTVKDEDDTSYGRYIKFEVRHSITATGAEGYLAGVPQMLYAVWVNQEGIQIRQVNPLLMAEFGSGQFADDSHFKIGMGRGTFPGQKHANEDYWQWQDLAGEWHDSSGIQPTAPMWKADVEMKKQILSIARQVFYKS